MPVRSFVLPSAWITWAISASSLAVSDLHTIVYEEVGNPAGRPALFLHGGPGGEIVASMPFRATEIVDPFIADRDVLVMPAHFPTPTAGRVRSDGAAFRFEFDR